MRTLSEIYKAIEKSKGKDIHFKLRGLDNTKTILNRNYFWLLQLNKYISTNIEIMELRNRNKLDDFQIEFARHLHNYLASVKSLVDHTRVIKRKLNLDEHFNNEYEKHRALFLSSDTIAFVQQLREFVQHYELLPSGVSISINENDDEKVTLVLSTKGLKDFANWNAHSKRILQANPEQIDIYKLIEEYQVAVNEFYKWFYGETELIFKSELKEFDALAKEYAKYHEQLIKDEQKT